MVQKYFYKINLLKTDILKLKRNGARNWGGMGDVIEMGVWMVDEGMVGWEGREGYVRKGGKGMGLRGGKVGKKRKGKGE